MLVAQVKSATIQVIELLKQTKNPIARLIAKIIMKIKVSILNEFNTELKTYVTDLDSYELSKKHNILIEKSIDEMINEIRYEQEKKNTTIEIPNPAEFMMLGETAFQQNVAEELRNKLSPTEKQMWLSGYLLALTKQSKR